MPTYDWFNASSGTPPHCGVYRVDECSGGDDQEDVVAIFYFSEGFDPEVHAMNLVAVLNGVLVY